MNYSPGYTAEQLIERLGMQPHVEGGWYSVIGPFGTDIAQAALPEGYSSGRKSASRIYYMLKKGEQSRWHILRSAEAWLWHCGGSAETTLGGAGEAPAPAEVLRLGPRLAEGEGFGILVPAGIWQTTRVVDGDFALVSCIVSPAFHDDDFAFPKGEGQSL